MVIPGAAAAHASGAMATTLTVMSAMITPAVLILACSSLILATSHRLGRMIDRARRIADRFEKLAHAPPDGVALKEERAALFGQLRRTSRRARLLQRAMTSLYLALSCLVATSVALGVAAALGGRYTWAPVPLGLAGAGLLFYATLLLIAESRIALSAVRDEMAFVLRLSRRHVPAESDKARPASEEPSASR
jgi:hypothetical protein